MEKPEVILNPNGPERMVILRLGEKEVVRITEDEAGQYHLRANPDTIRTVTDGDKRVADRSLPLDEWEQLAAERAPVFSIEGQVTSAIEAAMRAPDADPAAIARLAAAEAVRLTNEEATKGQAHGRP